MTAFAVFMIAPLVSMFIGYFIVVQTLVYLAMGVATVFLLVSWHQRLRTPAKMLYSVFVVLPLLNLLLWSARGSCIIGLAYCLVSWIYLAVVLKRYGFEKKKYVLENAIVPTALICEYVFMDWMHTMVLIDIQSGSPFPISLIMASLCAVVISALIAIRKKRIKPTLISFFASFGCALLVSLFFVSVVNYAFDFSRGELQSYEIVDKYSKARTGRRAIGVNYYLVIDQNGKEERVSVTAERYLQSKVGDSVDATLHDGFLGMSYLEYQ